METKQFDQFASAIRVGAGPDDARLRLAAEGNLEVYYAPFEAVNPQALFRPRPPTFMRLRTRRESGGALVSAGMRVGSLGPTVRGIEVDNIDATMLHRNTHLPGRKGVRRAACVLAALASVLPLHLVAQTVRLEDMTSPELRQRLDSAPTVALVPIGGTEQSGPQLVLGKHNARARELAVRIAHRLGNAVVAPVISYVPEGSIDPPRGHMRFAGTISIPDAAFESMLDGTARSLCQHGFRGVFFLGDHGGYQALMQRAADRVNRVTGAHGCLVRAVREYYDATQTTYVARLRQRGFSDREIGRHAGVADTSLSLALDPQGVRTDKLAEAARLGAAAGVEGDPSRSSAQVGQIGVDAIVDATVKAIRESLKIRFK